MPRPQTPREIVDAATNAAPAFLQDVQPQAPSEDRLEAIRAKIREARDLTAEIADLKERTETAEANLTKLQTMDLPDMLAAVNMDGLSLMAEGNLPAYDATVEQVVRAGISAKWEKPKQDAAFKILEERDAGSLIKTVVVFEFEREDRVTAKEFLQKAEAMGYMGEEKLSVNHNTLSAWLRAEVNAEPPRVPPQSVLDAIGGYIGKIVKLKPRKDDAPRRRR